MISVNQLSVYGVEADVCRNLTRNSLGTDKPAANENLESTVIPTEFPTANPISQIGAEVQGNLLREYEQKFADFLEQQKLAELCYTDGFSKNTLQPIIITIP